MLNAQRLQSGHRVKRSRDILDFIALRPATHQDDHVVGDLLVRRFTETYREKLPHVVTPDERISELRSVEARRRDGQVIVLELGYRIIGTAAVLAPGTDENESWLPNSTNVRCVAVDRDFHGLGFSHVLLSEAERLSRFWKTRYISLHVHDGASGVAELYKKRGFRRAPEGDMPSHGNIVHGYLLDLNGPVQIPQ